MLIVGILIIMHTDGIEIKPNNSQFLLFNNKMFLISAFPIVDLENKATHNPCATSPSLIIVHTCL